MEALTPSPKSKSDVTWKYFFRQLFVCCGAWSFFFIIGLNLGAPTVYIPQLRRESNSTTISDDMASWLSSISGFVAMPCLFIIAYLSKHIGRKTIFIIGNVDLLLALTIFYFSSTPVQFLISHVTIGFGYAATFSNNILIVVEYISPKYRGVFLAIKSTSVICGLWTSNAIGTFYNWKYIPLTGLMLNLFAFTSFFWPESPYYLARKRRYDECRNSYIWLNGTDEFALKDLEVLIESESRNKMNCHMNFKSFISKEFVRPVIVCLLLVIQYHFSGKFVFSVYALDVLKGVSGNESTAYYGMLILDGVTLLSMYVGCFLAKLLKRRTHYLTTSGLSIFFLFSISLYLYLIKRNIMIENKFISIILLTCFSVAISCGPMVLNTSIHAEILPSKFKSVGIILTSLLFYGLLSTTLKTAPYIFKSIDLDGAFLFYGVITMLCFLSLIKCLPETKDRTLQEIERVFEGKDRKEVVESRRLYT